MNTDKKRRKTEGEKFKGNTRNSAPIFDLLRVMARLRSPRGGCPWDLKQDHRSIRFHAVEEVYELLDAIEAGDDREMAEELGDLLLHVVFHSQLAKERGVFDFDDVCRLLVEKLIRRHPHVFGAKILKDADKVLAQWEHIKRAEKGHAARTPLHAGRNSQTFAQPLAGGEADQEGAQSQIARCQFGVQIEVEQKRRR